MKKIAAHLLQMSIAGVTFIAAGLPSAAHAGSFNCYAAHGGYCQYVGTVKRLYVNESNLILVYFDSPYDTSLLATAGITGVTANDSGAYGIVANATFAEYLYSTLLTAKTANRQVVMQFRGTTASRIKIDKIWLD